MGDLWERHTYQHPRWGLKHGNKPCENYGKFISRAFTHMEADLFKGGSKVFLSLLSKCPDCGIKMDIVDFHVDTFDDDKEAESE